MKLIMQPQTGKYINADMAIKLVDHGNDVRLLFPDSLIIEVKATSALDISCISTSITRDWRVLSAEDL